MNESEENVWQLRGSATLYKEITDRQNAFLRAWFGSTSNDVSYFGTTPYDNDFSDTYAGAALGYNFTNKQMECEYRCRTTMGEKQYQRPVHFRGISAHKSVSRVFSIPKAFFQSIFSLRGKLSGASEKTPNILQQNELLYYTGNPNLGLSRQITLNLSYKLDAV